MFSAGVVSCAFQLAHVSVCPSSSFVSNPTSWNVAPPSHEISLSTCPQQVKTWHVFWSVAVIFLGPTEPTMSQVTDTLLQESLDRFDAFPVTVTACPPCGSDEIVDGLTV